MQSQHSNLAASNGVDGNVNNLAHSSASSGTNVWWQVDLGADRLVSEIKLHNRINSRCGWRILTKGCSAANSGPGFSLGVSSTPCAGNNVCGGTVCKTIMLKSEMSGYNVPTVACPANTIGRFVYVQLLGPKRMLNFGEMQVAFTNYVAPAPALVSQIQAKVVEAEFQATDMSDKFQCDPVDRDVTDAACYGDRYAALKAAPYTFFSPTHIFCSPFQLSLHFSAPRFSSTCPTYVRLNFSMLLTLSWEQKKCKALVEEHDLRQRVDVRQPVQSDFPLS